MDEVGHEGDPGHGREEAPGQEVPHRAAVTSTQIFSNTYILVNSSVNLAHAIAHLAQCHLGAPKIAS